MAASPSDTTWRLLRTLFSSRASMVSSTSGWLSSTSKISTGLPAIAVTSYLLDRRQGEQEPRPFTRFGVQPHTSPVPFDDLLAYRQPDPRTRIFVSGVQ